MNIEAGTPALRNALVSLYACVAAVIRADPEDAELMRIQFAAEFSGLADALIVVSLATLERIEEVPVGEFGPRSDTLAREMLMAARGFRVAPRDAVHAAAWRLDAVRRCDRDNATADIAACAALGRDVELMRGAISLLAGIVSTGAVRRGRSPMTVAAELCLAACRAAST